MALALDRIKTHMEMFEGKISHMYLDTVGKVTVGVGNMLPDIAAAQALRFVDRLTGMQATLRQIATDFDAVLKQPKGLHASSYKVHTLLDLPEMEIDALLARRVQSFENELRDCYPKYDTFPDSAKLALLDMAFNLGPAGLRTKWPRLNAAISICDWHAAALECTRPQAQQQRNENTKALFEVASSELPTRANIA
jgi:GH24 family phage-related lysozyme (muramidase)